MTEWLELQTRDGANAFLPGETVEGTASWHLDQPVEKVELRLLWYTQGKGDQDVGVVAVQPFAEPVLKDRRSFSLQLPDGPYSFSGKLISLAWAIELVAEPGSRASRIEITVSPTGREILIAPPAAG